MNVHYVLLPDEIAGLQYGDPHEIDFAEEDSWQMGHIGNGYHHLFYWYHEAPYEGNGLALFMRDDDKWLVHDMSHCSCYGPFEHMRDEHKIFSTLEDVEKEMADDGTIKYLVDEARQCGLK